ncbi:hypothetical protein DFJ77DRAFT_475265 [Powellomyces hirtus]|nr:hypothetical protein DFJ77DRAFT_475265 [Powellomyces hirtus]
MATLSNNNHFRRLLLNTSTDLPAILQELDFLDEPPIALRTTIDKTSSNPSSTSSTSSTSLSATLEPIKRLSDSLFRKGFLSGTFSDFTLTVLGMSYALHRIVLLHNSYFACILQGPWSEEGKHTIHIHIDDPNVTVQAVTIVLGRIYGKTDVPLSSSNARSVLAAALFFADLDLCRIAVDFILTDISSITVLDYLLFADAFCYGDHSTVILEMCLTLLCRDGYARRELRPVFARMPIHWFHRIVSSDSFWVPGEEERWAFIVEIITLRRIGPPFIKGGEEEDRYKKTAWADQAVTESTHPARRERFIKQNSTAAAAEQGDDLTTTTTTTTGTTTSKSHNAHRRNTSDDASTDDDGLAAVLHHSVAYEHIPFPALLRIRAAAEKQQKDDDLFSTSQDETDDSDSTHSTNTSDSFITPFCDMLERAAWTQMKLQNMILSCARETTHLGIDEPIVVPRTDTRHIDGYCLSTVLADAKILPHDGSSFPPMRFGVEFHDLHEVATRDKVYSNKFFYAGSMWQVYLQNLPRQNPPILGVYLRRVAVPSLPSSSTPYADPRQTTVTWFQLFCYFGDNCFFLESKPDNFELEQSWGWKINKLYNSAFAGGKSLKCCVVLGHV